MSVASDRSLRTNKPLYGNALRFTKSIETAVDATVDRAAYLYHVDATAAVVLTLSDVPHDYEEHCFVRSAGAALITIAGNGKNINGGASRIMGAGELHLTIRYDATAGQWLERAS